VVLRLTDRSRPVAPWQGVIIVADL